MKRALVAALAMTLAGCATAYGEMGWSGGVQADQMSATRFRIVSRGNGYTDSTAVQDFAIRKAAETTLEHGYEWFVVVGEADKSSTERQVSTMPSTTYGSATTYGNTTNFNATTYGGNLLVNDIFKPGQDLMIELGRGEMPRGGFNAAETLRYVVPRTERR